MNVMELINMRDSLRKRDKAKLIYAYIISPILIYGYIGGGIINELYRKHGSKIFRTPTTLSDMSMLVNSIAWKIGILTYLPLILPITVIRFIIPKRELKYGIEMYCYMLVSMFLTRVLYVVILGELIPTLGFLDSLTIYSVLSYKATEYREIPRLYRYALTFFTFCAVFVVLYFSSKHFTSTEHYIFPIWEAITLSIILNMHKVNSHTKEPEQTYEEPRQELHIETPDMATRLVNIGLAHIGRKTSLSNKYLTPEQTEARKSIERPFLKILAEKFRDEAVRKKLARHFMLYKETTLFMIYAIVLKNNKELHSQVRSGLKEILSLNISSEVQDKRGKYWQEISRKFYDE